MLRIGLTGGIGSGKSTVARIFETLGVPVYYADQAARNLMNHDPELKKQISEKFGAQAYGEKGLNTEYIASVVFQNKEMLDWLNALTHPATIRDAEAWMTKQDAAYAIKEAALIFESGAEKGLDYVIGVDAPEELRITRTMNREKVGKEKVLARMKNQLPAAEKIHRCNFVIYNDEVQAVIPQVIKIHHRLLALTGGKSPVTPA